jgi:hypothetical protein
MRWKANLHSFSLSKDPERPSQPGWLSRLSLGAVIGLSRTTGELPVLLAQQWEILGELKCPARLACWV